MKVLGRITFILFLVGLGLVIAGLVAGGTGAFGNLTAEDYILVDETYDVGTIDTLTLSFANKNIEVLPSDTAQIRIVYYVTEEDPVVVTETATALAFEEEVDWQIRLFNWNWLQWFNPELFDCTVYLPVDVAFSLDMSTFNGSIDIDNLDELTTISANTSNGDITLADLAVSGAISIISSNGAFNVSNVTAGGNVNLRTSNGRITVDGLVAQGDVILKTSNGPVLVTGIATSDLEVDTSNGRIEVTFVGSYADYRILMETSNGSMYIDGDERNDGHYNTTLSDTIDLDTSNGNIFLNFND
ncbi:MAG TPA: hypothetical protein DCR44_07530 [Acholeplasmatales bacterium]|nr:MAG: hypothetical protein A2Y16_04200 [Tenericutes bacterium GWF2_57_13]HAQ57225.1 hypothetical protein [Acholeplasmatales bacterium]